MLAAPFLPPRGWETADTGKACCISRDPKARAWLESIRAKLPPGFTTMTREDAISVVAILVAQLAHSKKQARLYERMSPARKESASLEQMQTARALFHQGGPIAHPSRDRKLCKWSSAEAANWAGGYGWFAPKHRGPELSRVVCYEKTRFREIIQLYRLHPLKQGRESIFTRAHALQFLKHRLRAGANRRQIAERIWESVAWQTASKGQLPEGFNELRDILVRAGCPCTLTPSGRPDMEAFHAAVGI